MTGEINLPTLPSLRLPGKPRACDGALLKLLEPQIGLIDPGKTANAEVIALKQGGDAFQLLLKVTLDGGRQTLVQASSPQPLPLGSNVAVSQTPTGNLALSLQQALSANVAALTRIDTTQMPEGTLLQAKVLTTQMLPQGTTQPAIYRSLVTVLNNAMAGATLTVDSPQPLRVGSLLSAVVQNAQTLNFVPLSGSRISWPLPNNSPPSKVAKARWMRSSAHCKTCPATTRHRPTCARPPTVLAALPDLAQVSNPKVLAQVIQNSGAFLEAKLLAGQNPQVPPLDMKGALLRLVADLLPALPASTNMNAVLAANTLAQVLPNFVRSPWAPWGKSAPTGTRRLPAARAAAAKLEGEGDLENLLRLAAGAISRLQSHQLSSLEQTGTTADGRLQTTWQLEIPMRTLQDIVPLQVKFQREEPAPDKTNPTAKTGKTPNTCCGASNWLSTWSRWVPCRSGATDPGKLSSQLWATRPTASLIESHLGTLRERLLTSGLNVGDLDCHLGTPPRGPKTGLEHRWVDETA
jgi:hypothetical protein